MHRRWKKEGKGRKCSFSLSFSSYFSFTSFTREGEAEMLFSKDFELLLKLWTYAFAYSSSGTNDSGYK